MKVKKKKQLSLAFFLEILVQYRLFAGSLEETPTRKATLMMHYSIK
jgi:hypothetical protein